MATTPRQLLATQTTTRLYALAIFLLVTASCAVESPPRSALPAPSLELANNTAIGPGEPVEPRPNLGNIDLSYWHYRTSPPENDLDIYVGEFICSLQWRESVPVGDWVLVGISEQQRYTPILDIYGDQTGSRTKNDTVYYHFQLIDSE